jgi:HEAT repeat protein
MAIEAFIDAIADDSAPLTDAPFHEASDVSSEEVAEFVRACNGMEEDRRREVVGAMVEQAEENLELDFTAIFRQCLRDEDDRMAQLGVEGLWELEDRWLVAELVELLRSERGAQVRAAAALALGKFPMLSLEGKLQPQDSELVYRVLMDFLEDEIEDLEVRRRCLEAVSPFNTEEVQGYIRWAYEEEDQDLRSSSIFAMGRTGELIWLPTLLHELDSTDAAVRYETAHACGELGEQQAAPQLIELLQDDDPEVRLASIAALGKIGGTEARRALIDCVRDGDAAMSEAAHAELVSLEFLDDPMRLLPGDT